MYVCMFVCMYVCMYVCVRVSVKVCVSVSVRAGVPLAISLRVRPGFCLGVRLPSFSRTRARFLPCCSVVLKSHILSCPILSRHRPVLLCPLPSLCPGPVYLCVSLWMSMLRVFLLLLPERRPRHATPQQLDYNHHHHHHHADYRMSVADPILLASLALHAWSNRPGGLSSISWYSILCPTYQAMAKTTPASAKIGLWV